MKNKKILLIVSIVVVILLVVYYYFMIFKDRKVKLSVHEAGNFTVYTGELPVFDIKIQGMVNTGINKQVLDDHKIKPYRFDAVIETNWGEYTNTYVGYKMSDILSMFKDLNYKSITAYNVGGLNVTYSLDQIKKDSIFLVFYKDGKAIYDKKVAVISILDNGQYYVDNVVKIDINNVEAK